MLLHSFQDSSEVARCLHLCTDHLEKIHYKCGRKMVLLLMIQFLKYEKLLRNKLVYTGILPWKFQCMLKPCGNSLCLFVKFSFCMCSVHYRLAFCLHGHPEGRGRQVNCPCSAVHLCSHPRLLRAAVPMAEKQKCLEERHWLPFENTMARAAL